MTAQQQDPLPLPADLRARVLAASLAQRAAGRAVPGIPEISPVEALSRAADAFNGMLCALADGDWRRPVLRDLDVQGLVGHLIGVEDDVRRCLAGDPAVAAGSHIESTQPAADREAGRPPALTRAGWRAAVDLTLTQAGAADLGAGVAIWGVELPLGALLVVRAFELWTHENDIRRAAGLPPSVPDAPTLRQMTGLAAGLLPRGAALAGLRDPVAVHLVLTGAGGGTWDVAVGGGAADPVPVTIVTDAVSFCRLVANRAAPADLDLYITGDRGRAAGVLAAASALALD